MGNKQRVGAVQSRQQPVSVQLPVSHVSVQLPQSHSRVQAAVHPQPQDNHTNRGGDGGPLRRRKSDLDSIRCRSPPSPTRIQRPPSAPLHKSTRPIEEDSRSRSVAKPMYRTCGEEDEFLSSSREEDEEVGWTPPVIIPSRQEEEFLSSLRERDDHDVVCIGEKEEAERKELLVRSMVRPLLRPPAHGYPDEDGLPRPDFVLMEQQAYFIDRDNATTAFCYARPPLDGKVKVTFCTAPPPLVSYFCVDATAYSHTDLVIDPIILASETDGGLVLLCLIIGRSKSDLFRACCRHFFVYDSGTHGNPPSLTHIQHPGATLGGNYQFNGPSLAILRHCSREELRNPARTNSGGDSYRGPTLRPRQPRSSSTTDNPHNTFALHPHSASSSISASALHPHGTNQEEEHHCSKCGYVIVARDCHFGYRAPSFLCFYNSVTDSWSFKPVYLPAQAYHAYCGHITSKTLTIGDEVVWVDLSKNVIFCDVLANNPRIRVVGLPLPSVKKELTDPRSVRDIAILDGCLNFIELQHQQDDHDNIDGWMAASKWSMKITTGHSEDWHMDHKVYSSSILAGSSKTGGNAQPNIQKLHLGLPNLSLRGDNLAYFLAKTKFLGNEQTSWVIAVDLKNNVYESMEYNAIKTIGLSIGYGASSISKYLKAGKHEGHSGAVPGDGVRLQRHYGENPSGNHGGHPGAVMEQVRAAGVGQRQGRKRKQKRQRSPLPTCPSKK